MLGKSPWRDVQDKKRDRNRRTWRWSPCHSIAVSDTLWLLWLQHARLSYPSLSPGVSANSYPLNLWCHPTISSSVTLFSSFPQSFPASGSFPTSQLFTASGQSIGDSASVLPKSIQGSFPLVLTDLISLLSKGLSRVFSRTTVRKHQFSLHIRCVCISCVY